MDKCSRFDRDLWRAPAIFSIFLCRCAVVRVRILVLICPSHLQLLKGRAPVLVGIIFHVIAVDGENNACWYCLCIPNVCRSCDSDWMYPSKSDVPDVRMQVLLVKRALHATRAAVLLEAYYYRGSQA